MRRLIIIVLVLLVVAGGGAAGLVMLGILRNPLKHAPPQPDAVEQAAAAADAKAKANGFDVPTAALPIVKIGDLLIPIIAPDGSTRQLFVTARLVTAAGAKARVTGDTAPYIDAVLTDLIPYFQNYFRDHDLADLQILKAKLNRHAHDIFGDGVKDVLLVNVFESGTDPIAKTQPDDSD